MIMVYGGGDRARALLDLDEDAIRDRFLDDLDELFPQVRGHIVETMVKRWEYAGPFAAPGRWRAQAALERGIATASSSPATGSASSSRWRRPP